MVTHDRSLSRQHDGLITHSDSGTETRIPMDRPCAHDSVRYLPLDRCSDDALMREIVKTFKTTDTEFAA